MATPDRVLIDATNQTFWDLTNYKRGQRLDINDPQDWAYAQQWKEIYEQVKDYRTRAWTRANEVLEESMKPGMTVQPYVLIVQRRDGQVIAQTFPRRANLDVQYAWDIDQTNDYTYAAAFDFSQKTDGPVADAFAVTRRKQMAVSGWYY